MRRWDELPDILVEIVPVQVLDRSMLRGVKLFFQSLRVSLGDAAQSNPTENHILKSRDARDEGRQLGKAAIGSGGPVVDLLEHRPERLQAGPIRNDRRLRRKAQLDLDRVESVSITPKFVLKPSVEAF